MNQDDWYDETTVAIPWAAMFVGGVIWACLLYVIFG